MFPGSTSVFVTTSQNKESYPGGHNWNHYPGTLSSLSSHCHSLEDQDFIYCQTSNIRCTKSQNFNVSPLILCAIYWSQKSRIKMYVVGATPVGAAPTTSERSTILLPANVRVKGHLHQRGKGAGRLRGSRPRVLQWFGLKELCGAVYTAAGPLRLRGGCPQRSPTEGFLWILLRDPQE